MKTVRVKYLDSRLSPMRFLKGLAVTADLAIVRVDGIWNIVHRKTGVPTRHQHKPPQRLVVAIARAASKKYRDQLKCTDPDELMVALRAAGSAQWSAAWWKQHESPADL